MGFNFCYTSNDFNSITLIDKILPNDMHNHHRKLQIMDTIPQLWYIIRQYISISEVLNNEKLLLHLDFYISHVLIMCFLMALYHALYAGTRCWCCWIDLIVAWIEREKKREKLYLARVSRWLVNWLDWTHCTRGKYDPLIFNKIQ